MPRKRRYLDTQTLKYQDVEFLNGSSSVPRLMAEATKQEGRPASAVAPAPYWEFEWQQVPDGGLKLANLVAVGTDPAAPKASVPIAEVLDFTDLKIVFCDTPASCDSPTNKYENFPVAAAFAHKESLFEFGTDGTNTNLDVLDTLYQYGMMLTLVHDFGGTCKVTLRLSVVFRGATNDFDPGGVPVHMNLYPQIGWTWASAGSSGKRVKQFRGSVRVTVNNQTPATSAVAASGSMPEIMAMPAQAKNIANCFSDSNVSKEPGNTRCKIMIKGKTADLRFFVPDSLLIKDERPFGWGMVFDYMLMNIQDEVEYVAVYGPNDKGYYDTWRTRFYKWPASTAGSKSDYKVGKAPRQGWYDNIHLHGRMGMQDTKKNEQIHAPFCGHSCVHMHWRWSGVAAGTAPEDRRWYYKGWCTGKTIEGNTWDHSPLIPPNQRLTVALCRRGWDQATDAQILPSAGRVKLDDVTKLIWYRVDVIHTANVPINANAQQVILEAGLGWSYRYALPADKCPALYASVEGLLTTFKDAPDKPYTQPRIMEFFENKVYPGFRYYDDGTIKSDQIPQGNYNEEMAGPGKSMESL